MTTKVESRFAGLVSATVLELTPYTPGKPIAELKREKGLERIVKLASNENPLGASSEAKAAVGERVQTLQRYPDGYGYELKKALAECWDVSIDQIALGNGSSEIIEMTVRLFVRPGKKAIVASPSFSIYDITVLAQGGELVSVPLDANFCVDVDAILAAVDDDTSLVMLGNPNNPTGTIIPRDDWERLLDGLPAHVVILLDEAYAEYVAGSDFPIGCDYLRDDRSLIVARTFSKAYGLAALRLGYALAPAEIIDYMNRLRLPFNANGAAQAAGLAALADVAHLGRSVEANRAGRDRLYRFFNERGVKYLESRANFVMAKPFDGCDGDAFFEAMLDEGVIIRSASGFGLPEWVRITIGLEEEMAFFEAAFDRVKAKLEGSA